MTTGEPDDAEQERTSTKVERVLESGEGHFDLTEPPSRQEAGMPPGRSHVTYETHSSDQFRVTVALPEGGELVLDARLIGFDSYGTRDPATAPPQAMDIHYYPATLEAGRDHLLAAFARFGLDPQPIQDWYAEARQPRPVAAPPAVRSPWTGTMLGYLRLDIQGRYHPPVDTPESAQTVVHYLLSWE